MPEDTLSDLATGLGGHGTAVVASGRGGDDAVVAVWHVNLRGVATGAWVVSAEDAFTSRTAARKLLVLIERRAITALDVDDANAVPARLSAVAGLGAEPWWEHQVFAPNVVLGEISARRALYEATVTATKHGGKAVAPLEWAQDLPTSAPDDVAGLRGLAGLGVALGTPVISEVLTVARVLRWLVQMWAETEQVKGRRRYVRDAHGDLEVLPPSWLAAIQVAGSHRLPL
ncbi:MAG: DUF6218 family protein [Actinomycetota bacterium]|nr:DUF6218 family protein [Actinomycetota bacterium]